jgi:hypothetical protein
VIIQHQYQHQHRVVAEARAVAEADQAVGAHPLEVEGWSILLLAEELAEEEEKDVAEEQLVDDPHHLRFIKVRGFLLDTFLPFCREVPVLWKNWINVF